MERLNLRVPKPFDYSNIEEDVPQRIRFYCVAEGATEESYFWGIKNNRSSLNIKNHVFIEIVPKEIGQETFSHPMQLVNACLYAMGRIDADGEPVQKKDWDRNCRWQDFDPDIDIACVIFDRDYKDLESCLDRIFTICGENNIRVVISNPNFELWLLMHFPDILQYDRQMLLENRKNLRHQLFTDASVHKRYLEILVSKNSKGYIKGNRLKFERFWPMLDLALEQAGLFCQEPEKLRVELGTSVGRLIQDMRQF